VIVQSVWQACFDFLGTKPVVVTPIEAPLSSDAGLLPVRQLDERLGATARFAAALTDTRQAASVQHTLLEMVRMRVYGILADYEDQNDHDTLRGDPIFKLVAGRLPDDEDLASQPTLSRFENAVDVGSLKRLRDVLIDQFVAAFDAPPRRLTLDIDTFDDPTHGQQQLTFFHGYYDQYQYQPRAITCAENDRVLMVVLLYGSAHPALGADGDLEYLVGRLRAVWPDVQLVVRGDSGFGQPNMYAVCERLGLDYTFGLKLNSTLKSYSEPLLEQASAEYEQTGQPQRKFCDFWYQAGSWPAQRHVVVKVEVGPQGTNRRAVVTNRPGAKVLPGAVYDAYADRGESENRNKELKTNLAADRLSDHRYMANLFRLYLHTTAYNLLVALRQCVADPPSLDAAPPHAAEAELPLEARTPREKRRYFNRRRQDDPLGEGHANTWQTRLFKVAARVRQTARRVVVELSGCWPHLGHYAAVSRRVLAMPYAIPPAPD
jgi:hypothetical protein